MSIRIKFLPYLVAVLIGVIGAIILSQLHFTLWWEPDLLTQPPPIVEAEPETAAVEPLPTPQVPSNPQPNGLRVSNQTAFPVRVVLLAARDRAHPNTGAVHWDFAPMEGNLRGLLLTLPEGKLTLQSGDIVLAFTLDGSKRYWGPYVIGENSELQRDRQSQEWQLVLRP
ncbi:hypothetical protein NK55_10745 [Thermosynechococcus sp. NK55a]|jgi:hypothetical protein|uniref:hypothetical protein n=1 Tax=unclassified Thermosynechococcus TaxID=2622553 RepID=UPI0003D94E83|nr:MULTISPECIES: hypothetical protein [unclassified Thermosynechococcus]AHB89388.1 hypothetical protein NK55_10745 [Thermosynechococcus sp. NK55a]RMH67610.1 MAG: hypothetical protein D6676_01700 [Cyanobacteria bacterium J003]HIK22516.1 hypothetical protein [Thermosynechococcus sp. M3746_W2019_013]